MARKTIRVADIVTAGNAMLASCTSHKDEYEDALLDPRVGICAMVESVLFSTDNYHGYAFLPSEFDDDGNLRDGFDPMARRYFYSE